MSRLRVLTVTCSFPNPQEPGHSPFVRARMAAVAALAEVRVIAPVPWIDYGNPKGNLWQCLSIPARRQDGSLTIFHPRWLYPPFGMPWNILFLAARLYPLITSLQRQCDFDVLDSHFGYPDGAAATLLARFFRRPVVITLRGNELVYAKKALPRACLAWTFRNATALITVSEQLRRFAISLGASPDRVITIPNGVDSSVFYPRPQGPGRARWAVAEDARLIVSAGGLGPGKGHHLAVEAAARLNRNGRRVELLIAGGENRDGRFAHQIGERIRQLQMEGRIRLLGPMAAPALAELIAAADVFTLASFSEGWPNVVHEALACGVPVVATAVGAIPDMLADPVRGLTVPVNDVDALTSALDTALHRSWDREAIAAWGQSRSWPQVAAEVEAVFRRARPDACQES